DACLADWSRRLIMPWIECKLPQASCRNRIIGRPTPSLRPGSRRGFWMSFTTQYASPSASREVPGGRSVTTDIPARLDRLPWSRFHLLVMVALGVTWILDGLEVTIVGAIAPVLQNSQTLGLSVGQIGAAGSAYVIGAVVGALLFGWLTDRFGR